MQTKLHTLSACRKGLDMLIAESDNNASREDTPWFQNKLTEEDIGTDSLKLPDTEFISGVMKCKTTM